MINAIPKAVGVLILGATLSAASADQRYVISTYAGGAPPPTPVQGIEMAIGPVQSVAADALGNTYFVVLHCVFKLDQNGMVTRIAGNGRAGYSGDGGPATSAQLRLDSGYLGSNGWVGGGSLGPGVAVDIGGNLYVADNGNYRIRKISPDGIITTVAGNGTSGFSGDGGAATRAQLSPVFGLALDAGGNLWIADSNANRIRQLTPAGSIATVAGTGDCGFAGDEGPAAAAQLCGPTGIAADAAGNLFITDSENNRIRQISPEGTITTVAGTGPNAEAPNDFCAPAGDGGPATSATLCLPSNIAIDQAGNLFVADTNDFIAMFSWQVIRKISRGGIVTVAGIDCLKPGMAGGIWTPAPCLSLADGTTPTKTFLGGPVGLAVDNAGNLLIGNPYQVHTPSGQILKVSAGGAIATIAGNSRTGWAEIGDGGPATSAQLVGPAGVAVDGAGDVFIADLLNCRIRRVSPEGIISTIAGNGDCSSTGDGGPATNAQVAPGRLAVDGAGNLFFADGNSEAIRKISPGGMMTAVTASGPGVMILAVDGADDLFLGGFGKDDIIREVSPDGTIRTVAGTSSGGFSGDGGSATSAQLSEVWGVAVDTAGTLFIADSRNNRIRKVTPDGIITTIAGNGTNGFSGDGGSAIDAQLSFPIDVAVDGKGNLFIADYNNDRIREVSANGIITTIGGDGEQGYSGDGAPAIMASLSGPTAIAVDGAGNVFVDDSGNNAIRILRPSLADKGVGHDGPSRNPQPPIRHR